MHGLAIYRRNVAIRPLVFRGATGEHSRVHAQIVLYDGFDPLDVIAPFEVLAAGSSMVAGDLAVTLVAAEGPCGVVSGTRGLGLTATAALDPSEGGCVIVPGASGSIAGDPDDGVDTIPVLLARAAQSELTPLLRKAFANPDVTLAAVCGGSVVMAMSGLIEGRYAATHHLGLELLEAAGVHPVAARVVDDGDLITAGGVTSGLDLGLYLLDRVYGPRIAHAVEELFEYERRGTVWRPVGREPVEA
jgi:transcriptional regulator GlxA family with amidase domain